MREIRIHFEGDRRLRRGFHEFFGELIRDARQRWIRFELIPCGGRAVRDFMNALRAHPAALNLLLVDCEGPPAHCVIQRLRRRSDWKPPRGTVVGDNRVFRMIELMESWFLADQAALAGYYGRGFNAKRLPGESAVQAIPKDRVLLSLKAATRTCDKGYYGKTAHAPELLAGLDPGRVRAASPECQRLFDELHRALQSSTPPAGR